MDNEKVNNGTMPPEATPVPEVQPAAEVKGDVKKEPPKSSPPKKEMTPGEMQKRKKMLIMPLIFLIFGAVMWLIFAPSKKDEEKKNVGIGFNADLPMPGDQGMIGDKRDAYEKEAMNAKEKDKMRSLQDFAFQLGEDQDRQSEAEKERQLNIAPVPSDENTPTARRGSTSRNNAIQSSATAYQDINKQLGEWYEKPATEVDEKSQLAVESRIQELERKLDEEAQRKKIEEDQLAMVEKTYQMAAKYMPGASGQPMAAGQASEVGAASASTHQSGDKVIAQPVRQVRQSVVSLLAAPVSNEEFVRDYSQPRNVGFNTAAGNKGIVDKNSIRACVYQTITLTNGKEVQIRLLEPMQAGNMLIPANTLLTGSCRITGERLDVTISSIQYAENVIPVELLIYDMDGQRGIFIPGNDEINAIKEVASTLASSSGSSIMISDNAGSQLAADMGKGLIQGASQYVAKKMQTVKVTLKANYRILLIPKKQ